MKKFFCLMIVLFSVFSISYASMNIEYDGESHIYEGPEVNLILNGEIFTPSEGQMPPIIIENRTLVPVREVFEKLGGEVIWNGEDRSVSVTLEEKNIMLWLDKTIAMVDGEEVSLDVPGKLINGKTMVPVRFISEKAGLEVGWDGESTTVTISKPYMHKTIVDINSVNHFIKDNVDVICIKLSGKTEYNYFTLKEPDRLILDISNSRFAITGETIEFPQSKIFSKIRFGVQEDDVNRLVIDLNNEQKYTVLTNTDESEVYIAFTENFKLNIEDQKPLDSVVEKPNDEVAPPVQDDPEQDAIEPVEPSIPSDSSTDIENNIDEDIMNAESSEDIHEKVEITSVITAVKYSTTTEKARIILDDKFEYELTLLEEPKRIVLNFKNSALDLDGPTTITLKNNPISTIESTENEDGTARIVITISERATYDISKKTSELQVKVEEPSYRNIDYYNRGDYAEIILKDVELKDLTKTQSKTTRKYTIKYSSKNFDSGKGTIDISDDFIKKISITSTKIVISDKGDIRYVAKQNEEDVIITIMKAEENDNKIILLDAGHGGSDPGAVNDEAYEKEYNLEIMLRLKERLEEAGYTVYATREKDISLSVDDRVELATEKYPEAMLYVSIHHNSTENKNVSGTLVMYCDRDTSEYNITNKEFASYVLDELVDKLDTVNRGFIKVDEDNKTKRVLTEVPMPSILCEVAFISNEEEVSKIKTSKFQEAAAEAIFNGIEKASEDM